MPLLYTIRRQNPTADLSTNFAESVGLLALATWVLSCFTAYAKHEFGRAEQPGGRVDLFWEREAYRCGPSLHAV